MGLLKDLANAPARALQALLSDKKDESTNLSEKSKEIILSIREYEDSVEMPEDERITCLDSDRKVHLIAGNDKLPLIASIKPDGKGHYELETVETNLVLTVFGKDNFMNYFQGALTPDKIVYIDKKQGQKLERLAERQLFGNYSSLSPNTIIHQPKCIDKIKSAGQQTKEEAQDMDLSGMVNKVRDASEHKRDDNKVSRNEPEHEIDPR